MEYGFQVRSGSFHTSKNAGARAPWYSEVAASNQQSLWWPRLEVTDLSTTSPMTECLLISKKVSFFMPNCRVNGLEIQQKKSSIVKHIFQKVDEGVSEWCEWSIRLVSGKEFRCLSISFRLVRMEQRLWTFLPCVFLQNHLMDCTKDVFHVMMYDLKIQICFDLIQIRVRFSKNVMKERACPDHFFLGSTYHIFCVLSNFEVWFTQRQ